MCRAEVGERAAHQGLGRANSPIVLTLLQRWSIGGTCLQDSTTHRFSPQQLILCRLQLALTSLQQVQSLIQLVKALLHPPQLRL